MYVSLSLAMVVVIAALAITASQTPPPAIAELAPQAEQIKDAPQEQASELGEGDGGAATGGGSPTTTTTTTTPVGAPTTTPRLQPRLRRCVGQPPRQTEDPQSPPCVASWVGGDNGGATYQGVTADEIRVAVPTADGSLGRTHLALQNYFNGRYELYGRRLRLLPVKHAGSNVSCTLMKADAVRVDEELGAFASLAYSIQRGAETCYYDELATRGVMSMQMSVNGPPSGGEAHLQKFAPYQWNYLPSLDKVLRFVGELICKSLAGRPPIYAAGAQRVASVRSFGVVREVPRAGAPPIDMSVLESASRACGVRFVVVDQDTNISYQERFALGTQAILKLKDAGVTSVLCLCDGSYLGHHLQNRATLEAYYPEWIVQNYQSQDREQQVNSWGEPEQKSQVFGIRSWNKALPRDQAPFWQALREADPTIPPDEYLYSTAYWDLLVLASGIQSAGPKLTPQAFQSGLFRTIFPNPGCGGPPVYQGCVGFAPSTHTMIQDAAPVWFDQTTRPRDSDPSVGGASAGGYCYVDNGRRFRPGQWPSGEQPFFQGPCS